MSSHVQKLWYNAISDFPTSFFFHLFEVILFIYLLYLIIGCGVPGKWTMGSAVWWWKLSSFCCGSTCSLCKWTHCHLGSSSVWCSEAQNPRMRYSVISVSLLFYPTNYRIGKLFSSSNKFVTSFK